MSPITYWAKTTPDGRPGLSVKDHSQHVGAVAEALTSGMERLLERFRLSPAVAAAMAAVHDIGKISPGFQSKCSAWLAENGLSRRAQGESWNVIHEPPPCAP